MPFLQCFSDSAVNPEISAHMHAALTKNAWDFSGLEQVSRYWAGAHSVGQDTPSIAAG